MPYISGLLFSDAGQLQAVDATPPTAVNYIGGMAVAGGSLSSAVAEIITNTVDRDFSGAGNWTLNTGITVGAGVMSFSAVANDVATNLGLAFVSPDPLANDVFLITFTISGYSAGAVRVVMGGGGRTSDRGSNATFTQAVVCTVTGSGSQVLRIQAVGTTTLNVDNISVKLVPGGTLFVSSLGASAVPAGAVFTGGIAFAQDGRMYVTTDAPSSPSYVNGRAIRQDGALHVSTSAVDASDVFITGWAYTQSGVARMAIS